MPLIPIGLGWLSGLWAALTFDLSPTLFLVALAVPLAGAILWRGEPRARLAWIALLAALLGGMRAASVRPVFDDDDLATYNDRGAVTLVGVVDDYPDRRDAFVSLRVRAETLEAGWTVGSTLIEGVALVRADRLTDYRYGDRLEVTGELRAPPEFATFNYRDYLAGKGVHAVVDRPRIEWVARDQASPILAAVYDLKDRARNTIAAILPEPQAALLTGILLGDDAGIPQSVKDDFRLTGTSHIIAISGYNFGILIWLASVPAVRLFGRRRAFFVLLGLVFGYAILVGWSASVVRAAFMGALTLWAVYLGRQATALNSLFIAAILMTLLDPFTLGDVGFQLSFAATLGLVLYTRPLQNAVERGLMRFFNGEVAKKIVGALGDAVLVTLAAQITTLPILFVTFRQVSLLTLLVNALVLPAQTGVMLFGGLALLAGMVFLPIGQLVGWAAWLFLAWTIQVTHLFALVPGVSIDLGYVDPLWGVAYVGVLAAATFWLSRNTEQRRELMGRVGARIAPRIALPAVGVLALLGIIALSWRPDGKLHVHALNVEGGPVFVQTPSGRQILIGGSNSPSALLAALGQRMPFWDRDIDLLVVPRGDTRSLNGLLAVVDRYRVGQVVSVEIGDHRAGREWLDTVATQSIEVLEAGSSTGIEEGIVVTLDEVGWAHIAAGNTSIGVGMPNPGSRADVIVLNQVSNQSAEAIKSIRPQIVVAHELAEPDLLPGDIAYIITDTHAVELIFDGALWMILESV